MKVLIQFYPIENVILITPCSKSAREVIKEHTKSFIPGGIDSLALTSTDEVEAELSRLGKQNVTWLKNGHSIQQDVDEEEFLSKIGHDCEYLELTSCEA